MKSNIKRTPNLVLALLFVTMNLISNCQPIKSNLQLTSKLMSAYRLCQSDSNYYFLVEVNLFNNSDSIYSFVAYNCWTNKNLIIDHEQIEVCQGNCTSNYPLLISIDPHHSFSIPIILKAKQRSSVVGNFIRIGIVLLPMKDYSSETIAEALYKMKKNKKNILWGNSFILGEADCQPFKIN